MTGNTWDQRPDEPLVDYVKRLEGVKAEQDKGAYRAVERDNLNAVLVPARKQLRAMKAQLKKTPNIRAAEGQRRDGPALREVMRLFRQLTCAERETFMLWHTSGMPQRPQAPPAAAPSDAPA